MHSLFVRIFVLFWIAMAIIVAGSIALTFTVAARDYESREFQRRPAMAIQASEVLARGGVDALRSWLLANRHSMPDRDLFIIGPNGVDILGRPLSESAERRLEFFRESISEADSLPPPPDPPGARPPPSPRNFRPQRALAQIRHDLDDAGIKQRLHRLQRHAQGCKLGLGILSEQCRNLIEQSLGHQRLIALHIHDDVRITPACAPCDFGNSIGAADVRRSRKPCLPARLAHELCNALIVGRHDDLLRA